MDSKGHEKFNFKSNVSRGLLYMHYEQHDQDTGDGRPGGVLRKSQPWRRPGDEYFAGVAYSETFPRRRDFGDSKVLCRPDFSSGDLPGPGDRQDQYQLSPPGDGLRV